MDEIGRASERLTESFVNLRISVYDTIEHIIHGVFYGTNQTKGHKDRCEADTQD